MFRELLEFDCFLLIRLVVAALFGGIIGLERSENNHAAGLRTHILLCLGAASIMVVSEVAVQKFGIPEQLLRMGAQIISGVGFLGAGSIVIDGRNNKIQGITTAAGLWTTACLGIVVGLGYYVLGTTMLAIMVLAMLGLRPVAEKLSSRSRNYRLVITYSDMSLSSIIKTLTNKKIDIKSIRVDTTGDEKECVVDITLPKKKMKETDIFYMLEDVKAKIEISKI